MRRSLSPAVFNRRKRSQSQAIAPPGLDDILFPKSYEDEWDLADSRKPDPERARFFLVRFANTNADPMIQAELVAIASHPQNRTVPALAQAVQTRIFANRHPTFAATPLLQCMRYLLIKTRVPELMVSDRTKLVLDFYFDPTMARNIDPLPKDPVTFRYPAARLKVCIVGGGPTGLASAISLAEKGAGNVEVHVYERRWVRKINPNGSSYIDYPPTAKRRDQVVTLQESVTTLLSKESQDALFAGRPEHVWPGSANLQIRKVEDRLLKRCQAAEFRGLIHLYPEGVERATLSKVGDFHVLLGTDGAASWVRKSYFEGYEKERGRSYALGLAFNRPEGLPWSQPLNMFLTLGQTRYLLNASNFDGRGYLNMQLTEEEWHKMVDMEGKPVTFGNPGCLRGVNGQVPEGFEERQVFAPSEDRDSLLWKSIEDGLKLFGFKESEVINVVRIPIVVQAVREGVQHLPPADSMALHRPQALVAVAGDAAMTVHFWPGRGLNSGIKSGIAIGDEIVNALNSGQFVGVPIAAMKEYNDFIQKLQGREHDKRSIPILNQSGTPETLGWLLSKAESVPDNVAIEWLVGAMMQIADRLQTRPGWPFEPVVNIEPQLRIVLRQLTSLTLKEMAVSFPWPTREMGGAEVLPIRSMKPEEKSRWLQQLFTTLTRDDKSKSNAHSRTASSSRFEAPRSTGPLPLPLPSPTLQPPLASPTHLSPTPSLQRNNATRAPSIHRLSVPVNGNDTSGRRKSISGEAPRVSLSDNPRRVSLSDNPQQQASLSDDLRRISISNDSRQQYAYNDPQPQPQPQSQSQFQPSSDGASLVRLLSTRRPNKEMLADAMSLALFRVDE